MKLLARLSVTRLSVAVLAFVMYSCGGGQSNDPPSEFFAAHQKWLSANIQNYQFTLTRRCYCIGGPFVITVKQGVVESAFEVISGQYLPPDQAALLPTINGLFDIVHAAYINDASTIRVDYDGRYGFPVTTYIDRDSKAVDDEIQFEISQFM